MSKIAVVFNNENRNKMLYELQSLEKNRVQIDYIPELTIENYHKILICDNSFNYENYPNKKIVLIISDYNFKLNYTNNLIFIQYENEYIKKEIESQNDKIKFIPNEILNVLPSQKIEINPLETQNATIFFHGEDKPENMVDEMFDLDTKVYYEIKFYDNKQKVEPSKKHRLSWNVTVDKNLIGIIHSKIIKEIENGCLPILLKESMPLFMKRYPFIVTKEELKDTSLLINAIKKISAFIANMTRDEFKMLTESVYNGIYIESKWKYKNYIIAEKIKETLDKL